MNDALTWIHEDALSAHHPVCAHQTLSESACFVWDEAHLKAMNYGFQRLVFIYETLCELQVPVYRGDTVEVLSALAAHRGVDTLRAAWTPNPAIQGILEELDTRFEVERVFEPPFVALRHPPELRRFFSYWKAARPHLMEGALAEPELHSPKEMRVRAGLKVLTSLGGP